MDKLLEKALIHYASTLYTGTVQIMCSKLHTTLQLLKHIIGNNNYGSRCHTAAKFMITFDILSYKEYCRYRK